MVAASFGAFEAIGETGKASNWHGFPSWLSRHSELYTPQVFLIGTEPFGPDPSTLIGAMDLSCAPARWGRNLEAGEGHSAANRCWDWSWMNPEMSCFEQSTPRTGDEKLSTAMRRLLDFLWQEWKGLQMQIESLNTELEQIASSDPSCVRLQTDPGSGSLGLDCGRIGHRERRGFQKRTGVCGLAGTGAVLEYPGPDLVRRDRTRRHLSFRTVRALASMMYGMPPN